MSKLVDLSLSCFLAELASNSPAPGGGSAAAVSGAIAAALSSMVCNLTVGKEKYRHVEKQIKEVLAECEKTLEDLKKLVDEDTVAFNEVIKAFRMPRDTMEEKQKRKEAVQKAYKKAAEVPLKTAETCGKILSLAEVLAEKGNQNSVTDAGVSALMANTSVKSAALNVKINLGSIDDPGFVQETILRIEKLEEEAENKTKKIIKTVKEKMG